MNFFAIDAFFNNKKIPIPYPIEGLNVININQPT